MNKIYLNKKYIETLSANEFAVYVALKKQIDDKYKANADEFIMNTNVDFIIYELSGTFETTRSIKNSLELGLQGLIEKEIVTLIAKNKGNYIINAKELYIDSDTQYTQIEDAEIKNIFNIEHKEKLDLFRYGITVLSTIWATEKYAFHSIDDLSFKANISKPTAIKYNDILEENKIIYIHRLNNAKRNENGTIQRQANTYGRYRDKADIIAKAMVYDAKVNHDYTKQLAPNIKTQIKQQYNSYVKGSYKQDAVELYQRVLAYNEDVFVQKYNNQLDVQMFDNDVIQEFKKRKLEPVKIKELNQSEDTKRKIVSLEKAHKEPKRTDYYGSWNGTDTPF